jgi:hypothetical protein
VSLPTSPNTTYLAGGVPAIKAQDLNDLQTWLCYLYNNRGGIGFGSGVDGTLVFDGSATVAGLVPSAGKYTMTRDLWAGSGGITVTGASTVLATNSYRVYSRGGVVTASGGKITCNGNAASGATAGAESTFGSIATGSAGGAGGTSTTGAQGVDRAYSSLGAVTNLGSGGAGSAGAGGRGALATSGDLAFMPGLQLYTPHLFGLLVGAGFSTPYTGNVGAVAPIYSGLGGGGGGAGSGNGGGGGAGGGLLAIAAPFVQLASASDLQAAGGAGGNAAGTNAGGGGGGTGGLILLATGLVTASSGTVNAATCCPGGAGGTKNGTGVAGTAGITGSVVTLAL